MELITTWKTVFRGAVIGTEITNFYLERKVPVDLSYSLWKSFWSLQNFLKQSGPGKMFHLALNCDIVSPIFSCKLLSFGYSNVQFGFNQLFFADHEHCHASGYSCHRQSFFDARQKRKILWRNVIFFLIPLALTISQPLRVPWAFNHFIFLLETVMSLAN